MSSKAKVDFITVLSKWLNEERPKGLPQQVETKDGDMVDLHLIPEHALDPITRPAIVLIADPGSSSHPKVITFELRVENIFSTDDFDPVVVIAWQQAVVDKLNEDMRNIIPDLNDALCGEKAAWFIRKIVAGGGESGVEGQRSRGLTDSWIVWMMKA